MPPIAGVIFDLDGTLIDSALDFEAMRQEMDLPPGAPILETLETMAPDDSNWRWEILLRHELEGAERSLPLPGVLSLLAEIDARGLPRAIITRNSRPMAEAMLKHLPVAFDPIITRDDGPVKPDPWSILHICETWQISPNQVAMIGDFNFDIAAGRSAGAQTAYFHRDRIHQQSDPPADICFADFNDASFQRFLFGASVTRP